MCSLMSSAPVAGRRAPLALPALVAACLLAAVVALATFAVERSVAADPDVVPGELVVGFRPSATEWQERRAVDKANGEIATRIDSVDAAVITVDPDQTDDASTRLLRNRAVQFVEPNYVLRANRLPNDRSFGEQWGLRNLGRYGGKPNADVHATTAWDITTGGEVTVAVVDTGVSLKH